MVFKKIYRGIRRSATGRVVKQIDTHIVSLGSMKVSVRLKTEAQGPYAVLALISPGNYQYCPMDMGELDSVILAMQEIRDAAVKLQISN